MKSGWKKCSIICGVIGLCCIVAAGLIVIYNLYDDVRAARELKEETEKLEAVVLSYTGGMKQESVSDPVETPGQTAGSIRTSPDGTKEPTAEPLLNTPAALPETVVTLTAGPTAEPDPTPAPGPTPMPESMPIITMDGWDYVAIISIPALDLEFCVRNEWSKAGAKKSPCRYTGSVYTDDLIICAHNYSSHFGRLKELKRGDRIILIDMRGEVYTYHVEYTEEIGKFDVAKMVSSGYDLSLFTCTIGGKARVTVRCTRDS